MPWLCGWIDPANLAANNNPIGDPQIYPTLYEWGLPADDLAERYCAAYASYGRRCREAGVVFWPMFNVAGDLGKLTPDMGGCMPSDSLLRLPAYAAVAYGAEGIWYFIYNSGALQHLGPHTTDADVARALTPLYPVARRVNRRIASWGPLVMGRTCQGVFGTAFRPKSDWPCPEDLPPYGASEELAEPGAGKLIEGMDENLIVGVLTGNAKRPLAMVVDCRAAKSLNALPEREVEIRFASQVARVRVLEGGEATAVRGATVRLRLEAGGGQMLELEGNGLGGLAEREAIYRSVAHPQSTTPAATVADLEGATAARLRLDVYGSNGGAYAEKWVILNGVRIGQVPVTNRDAWTLTALSLAPEHLTLLRPVNELVVTNEGGDAWKFRNVALAIRRRDGTWVKSATASAVHSSPNWAHSEGTPFGPDGKAGPIVVRIGP